MNFKRFGLLILVLLTGCGNLVKIDYTRYEKGKTTQAILGTSHQGAVSCLAVTTDSRFIVSGSFDKTVKIWLTDGTFVKSINTGALVNAVGFNQSGNYIIAGLSDKTVQVWSFDGIKVKTALGHNAEITCIDVEPGGGFFVSGSKDKTLKIWDSQGNLKNNILAHDDTISAVKVNSALPMKEIVSASWDGTIKIWNSFGFLLSTIKDENNDGNYVEALTTSQDGQLIVAGYSDGFIKLWSRDGKLIKSYNGHSDYVKSLAITKNNQTIISGSADNSIIMWNTNGTILKSIRDHKGIVRDIKIVPSGENFISASSDDTMKIWSPTGYLLKSLSFHSSQISAIASSRDLKSIFTAMGNNSINVWNTQGDLIRTIRGLKKPAENMLITPDNKIITADKDNNLEVRTTGGSYLRSINVNDSRVNCYTISPFNSQIFTGLSDYSIKIWDSSGNPIKTLKAHGNQVTAIAVTPDGKNILSSSMDKTLKIWNTSGKVIFDYTNPGLDIKSIQVSLDSKYFLTESPNKVYQLWSIKGEMVNTFKDNISTLCFMPDPGLLLVKAKDDQLSVRNYKGQTVSNFHDIEEISEMEPLVTSKTDKKNGKYIVAKNSDDKLTIFNARNFNYIRLLFSDKAFFFQDNFGYYDCNRDMIKTTKIAKGYKIYDLEQYDKLFYRKNVYDYFMVNKVLTNRNIETVVDNLFTINITEPQDKMVVRTNAMMLKFTINKQNINLKNLYVKVNARKYNFNKYVPVKSDLPEFFGTTYQIKINLNRGNNAIYCGYNDISNKMEVRSEKITIFNK